MSSTAQYVPDLTGTSAASAPGEMAGGPGFLSESLRTFRGARMGVRLENQSDLARGVDAGWRQIRSGVGLTTTAQRYESELYREMLRAVDGTGVPAGERRVDFLGSTLMTLPGKWVNPAYIPADRDGRRNVAVDRLLKGYAEARRRDPALPEIGSREAVAAEVAARRQRDLEAAEADTPDSFAGQAGAFIGQMGGGFTDPTVILTMGIGASGVVGKTLLGTVAKRAGAEALLQGGVAAVMLPALFDDADANGLDYDAGDAALDVGLGMALGGAVGGASGLLETPRVKAAGVKAAATLDGAGGAVTGSARDLVRALKRSPDLTDDEARLVRAAEAEIEVADATPFADTPEGEAVHGAAMEEAADALLEGRASGLPQAPALPVKAPEVARMVDPGALVNGRIYQISAKLVQTDPETFQYKADGDGEGVTGKLRNVTAWNDDAAGLLMLWQRADGDLFVADGHQRSGLARRLIAEGRADDIELTARVYREADGVSATVAMLRAAGSNMASGTGTALDAAKIIRRVGVDSPYLKGFDQYSALGRAGIGLSRLSDEAFGVVINGDPVTADIGAVVGRVAEDDPALHAQMIAALRTEDWANLTQLELIARDMLAAPRVREVQTDMFGQLVMTRGLFAERAKVLDRALAQIKGAKRALVSAAENADTIAEAGGQVDRARAESVAADNARLAELVETLARLTDNPVNAALSRAATEMAEGKRVETAAKDFIAGLRAQPDVIDRLARGAVDSGTDGSRAGNGSAARAGGAGADAAAQGRAGDAADSDGWLTDAAAPQRGFADFDDPAGPAAKAQADHLLHDLRMDAELESARIADDADPEVELDTQTVDLFALNAADEPDVQAAIADIDGDDAVWKAVKGCLPGGAQ